MSAELAVLNKAKNNSGETKVIYKEDFDTNTMVDISDKFFTGELISSKNIDESTSNIIGLISGTPISIYFNPDGTVMYISETNLLQIHQFDCSIAWDIQSAVLNSSSTLDVGIKAIGFSKDGSTIITNTSYSGDIAKFSLATPWDISTINPTPIQEFTIPSSDIVRTSYIIISEDGGKMWGCSTSSDIDSKYEIVEWRMSTPFDITTLLLFQKNQVDFPCASMYFTRDGYKLLLYYLGGLVIRQFNLITPFDISTASDSGITLSNTDTSGYGLYIKPDGTKFYLQGYTSDITQQFLVDLGGTINQIGEPPVINPNDQYKIIVTK